MADHTYDVIVIGTGPGGEGAAMQLAKGGKRVAVVEKYHRIGGGCTHWGTIPSKALRYSIYQITEALNNPVVKESGIRANPSLADMRRSSQSVISRQENMRRKFYDRNDVDLLVGHARFLDPHKIQIDDELTYEAEHFVIATGSRPFRPDDVDFSHPHIYDSDRILGMEEKPKSITVYGAGVIGCEYASMFRNMDIKVNLVNTRSKLLEFLDDEIIDALAYHMRDRGILLRHNEQYSAIEGQADGVVLHLESGKQLKTDALLWAVGRVGNVENLGLEHAGITPKKRGYLQVNDCYQTDAANIYAVGDIIGFPSLASAAYTQGRAAGMNILDPDGGCHLIGNIPSGIYTSPEISSVGKTERELTEARIPYEVGHSQFKSLARAQITGQTVGMLKLLFHRETLELLGVHCFGANASEIVHIGQAIMSQPGASNTLMYFVNATFNYPTMAEAYRVAALNGLNRLF